MDGGFHGALDVMEKLNTTTTIPSFVEKSMVREHIKRMFSYGLKDNCLKEPK